MEPSRHCPLIGQPAPDLQLQGSTVPAGPVAGKKHPAVSGNHSRHIGHATAAQFDVAPIAYTVQAAMGREALLEQVKEDLSDVSPHMLAEGWVKPHHISPSRFPLMGAGRGDALQPTGTSTSPHSPPHSGTSLANSSRMHESDERRSASIDRSCLSTEGGRLES